MGLFVSNYNFQQDGGKNDLLLSTRNLSSSKWKTTLFYKRPREQVNKGTIRNMTCPLSVNLCRGEVEQVRALIWTHIGTGWVKPCTPYPGSLQPLMSAGLRTALNHHSGLSTTRGQRTCKLLTSVFIKMLWMCVRCHLCSTSTGEHTLCRHT